MKRLAIKSLILFFGLCSVSTNNAACSNPSDLNFVQSSIKAGRIVTEDENQTVETDWSGKPFIIDLHLSGSTVPLKKEILTAQPLEPLPNGMVPKALLGFTIENLDKQIVTGPLTSFDSKKVTDSNKASLKIHQWAIGTDNKMSALEITSLFERIPLSDFAEFARLIKNDSGCKAARDLNRCLKSIFNAPAITHHTTEPLSMQSRQLPPPPGLTQQVVAGKNFPLFYQVNYPFNFIPVQDPRAHFLPLHEINRLGRTASPLTALNQPLLASFAYQQSLNALALKHHEQTKEEEEEEELLPDPLKVEKAEAKKIIETTYVPDMHSIEAKRVIETLKNQKAEKLVTQKTAVQLKIAEEQRNAEKKEQLEKFQKSSKLAQEELQTQNVIRIDNVVVSSSFVTGNLAKCEPSLKETEKEKATPSSAKKKKKKTSACSKQESKSAQEPDHYLDAAYNEALAMKKSVQEQTEASSAQPQAKKLTLKERQEISRLEKEKAALANELNKKGHLAEIYFHQKNFSGCAHLYAGIFEKTKNPLHRLRQAVALKANKNYTEASEILDELENKDFVKSSPGTLLNFFIDKTICKLKAYPATDKKEVETICTQIQKFKEEKRTDGELTRLAVLEHLILTEGKHPDYPEVCNINQEHADTPCAHTKLRELAPYLPPSIHIGKIFADGKGGPRDLLTALKLAKPLEDDPNTPYNVILEIARFYTLNNDSKNAFLSFQKTLTKTNNPEEVRKTISFLQSLSENLDFQQITKKQLEAFEKMPKESLTDSDMFNWAYAHLYYSKTLVNQEKQTKHRQQAQNLFGQIKQEEFYQKAHTQFALLAGPNAGITMPQPPEDEIALFLTFKNHLLAMGTQDEQEKKSLLEKSKSYHDRWFSNEPLSKLVPVFNTLILQAGSIETLDQATLRPLLATWSSFLLAQQNHHVEQYLQNLFLHVNGPTRILENIHSKLADAGFDSTLPDTKKVVEHTLNLFGSTFKQEELESIVQIINHRLVHINPALKATKEYLQEIKNLLEARIAE